MMGALGGFPSPSTGEFSDTSGSDFQADHRRALGRQEAHRVGGVVVADERLPRNHAAGPDAGGAPDPVDAHPDDALERLHIDEVFHQHDLHGELTVAVETNSAASTFAYVRAAVRRRSAS